MVVRSRVERKVIGNEVSARTAAAVSDVQRGERVCDEIAMPMPHDMIPAAIMSASRIYDNLPFIVKKYWFVKAKLRKND